MFSTSRSVPVASRINTIKCVFDRSSLKPSAAEVHEWIFTILRLEPATVAAIQLDCAKQSVYIKMKGDLTCDELLTNLGGSVPFRHVDGSISKVAISHADLGYRQVRVFNLPLELPNERIRDYLRGYGLVREIVDEVWSTSYRYQVKNGIRCVRMDLNKHIPSYITIGGTRALVTYEGQMKTCSICNANDHFRAECKARRPVQLPLIDRTKNTWANLSKPLVPAPTSGNDQDSAVPTVLNSLTPHTQDSLDVAVSAPEENVLCSTVTKKLSKPCKAAQDDTLPVISMEVNLVPDENRKRRSSPPAEQVPKKQITRKGKVQGTVQRSRSLSKPKMSSSELPLVDKPVKPKSKPKISSDVDVVTPSLELPPASDTIDPCLKLSTQQRQSEDVSARVRKSHVWSEEVESESSCS